MADDPITPADHTLRPGDHLGRVGSTYRFRSFAPIWNDPTNADLRRKRPNPHIMAAGEHAHVPELNYQECDRPTEQRHKFRAELHPLEVHVKFQRWDGKPLTDVASAVLVDGKPVAASATPGALSVPIDPLADRIAFKVATREPVLRVGFLQPVDTVPGARQRLNNLGYRAGDADDANTLAFRSAIEEFQCDQHLAVDGKLGPATRQALTRVHGC